MKPKVSILIPVYNTEAYIAQTIESVLKQTFTDFELVIVDDCSTDNTYEICQEYAQKEERIKLFKNEKNLGMMPNWNHGITLCNAKAQYWGKLDADDYWHERMIEDCVNVLDEQEEAGMVCSRYVCIDEKSEVIPNSEYQFPDFAKNQALSFIPLVQEGLYKMFSYHIAQQGIGLMRMEIFSTLGKFTLLDAGDTEMWFRIGANHQIYALDKLYHYHRIWSENFTRQKVLLTGKLEKNLFDVRKAIFDYYHQNQKITSKEYRKLSNDNQFEYNKFLVYKNRKDKKYGKMFSMLFQNFFSQPQKTITFYFSRLRKA
jgi:glycosyltransferase involved in cell wall biosynthesis